MYLHPDSKIETLEEIKRNRPDLKSLSENMELYNLKDIVITRYNKYVRREKDMVILKGD